MGLNRRVLCEVCDLPEAGLKVSGFKLFALISIELARSILTEKNTENPEALYLAAPYFFATALLICCHHFIIFSPSFSSLL